MKLTTRGRYAVTAMLDLALHEGDGPVALGEIASRQDISLSYLEQLFSRLRRQGLVTSTRGPGGGYRLSRPAGEVSVAHVVDAVAERVEYTRCGGERNCQNHERCLTHDLWQGRPCPLVSGRGDARQPDGTTGHPRSRRASGRRAGFLARQRDGRLALSPIVYVAGRPRT